MTVRTAFLAISLLFLSVPALGQDHRTYERYKEVDIFDPYEGRRAVAGKEGWEYAKTGLYDLNGNGNKELIVLTANADVDSSGEPQWSDGHRWQLYIQDLSGERTYVFANFVQLASPKISITERTNGRRSILLRIHREYTTFRVYEILYEGPREFTALEWGHRTLRGELQNPSGFFRNRAPHRSAEELRETMDLLRERQRRMSTTPDDTTDAGGRYRESVGGGGGGS